MARKVLPLSVKIRMYHEQDGRCCYCGVEMLYPRRIVPGVNKIYPLDATWEHVKPKSMGGKDGSYNSKLACHSCNQKKGVELNRILNAIRYGELEEYLTATSGRGIMQLQLEATPPQLATGDQDDHQDR